MHLADSCYPAQVWRARKSWRLSHELELVEAYLFIEKTRFEDRLSVVLHVEPDLPLLLPPLSIQPLIENAVRHGLLSRNVGGTLCLSITRHEGYTRIEVKDNSKGIEPEMVAELLHATPGGKGGKGRRSEDFRPFYFASRPFPNFNYF
ncbi:hypothetical protein J7E78_28355 [Paenibacillus polymyxa]|uniref:sensor histidine kinase n=1 Tax=Paenibacillus polymyxa TaxID=1406 RepID=UPI001BE8A99F|nr:hypothetical protein [Paenibacillus polymyxa]MBT2287406.1 hypothetical protein [Paenibacillus polymyxa]